jgi:hypothetical protein
MKASFVAAAWQRGGAIRQRSRGAGVSSRREQGRRRVFRRREATHLLIRLALDLANLEQDDERVLSAAAAELKREPAELPEPGLEPFEHAFELAKVAADGLDVGRRALAGLEERLVAELLERRHVMVKLEQERLRLERPGLGRLVQEVRDEGDLVADLPERGDERERLRDVAVDDRDLASRSSPGGVSPRPCWAPASRGRRTLLILRNSAIVVPPSPFSCSSRLSTSRMPSSTRFRACLASTNLRKPSRVVAS